MSGNSNNQEAGGGGGHDISLQATKIRQHVEEELFAAVKRNDLDAVKSLLLKQQVQFDDTTTMATVTEGTEDYVTAATSTPQLILNPQLVDLCATETAVSATPGLTAGFTVLHSAASRGFSEMCKILLQGWTVEDSTSITPFVVPAAVQLKMLLTANYRGMTPIHVAVEQGHVEVLRELLAAASVLPDATVEASGGIAAAATTDVKGVVPAAHTKAALKRVLLTNNQKSGCLCPLHMASHYPNDANATDQVILLASAMVSIAGVSVDTLDHQQQQQGGGGGEGGAAVTGGGKTALQYACEGGAVDNARLLITMFGADVNAHYNPQLQKEDQGGAEHVNQEDATETTTETTIATATVATAVNSTEAGGGGGEVPPLVCAIQADSPDIVGLLLDHGASLEGEVWDLTPFHYASLRGNVDVMALLLAAWQRRMGGGASTPVEEHIHGAAAADQEEGEESGAGESTPPKLLDDTSTPHAAVAEGEEEVEVEGTGTAEVVVVREPSSPPPPPPTAVALLLSEEESAALLINRVGRLKPPLSFAISRGFEAMSLLLIQSGWGLDLHIADREGDTALHHAVRCGSLPTTELLLQFGGMGDITRPNKQGQTAMDVAKQQQEARTQDVDTTTGHTAIMQLFLDQQEMVRVEAENKRKQLLAEASLLHAANTPGKSPGARVLTYMEGENELGVGTSPRRNDLNHQRAKYESGGRIEKMCFDQLGIGHLTEEHLKEIFVLFDPNSDGLISKAEFRPRFQRMFENYGAPVTDQDVDRLFAKFDLQSGKGNNKIEGGDGNERERGGDGFLNFTEFSLVVLYRSKQ